MEKDIYGKILETPAEEVKQSSTMNVITVAGGLFLFANIVLLVIIYFKCKSKRNASKITSLPLPDGEKVPKDSDGFVLNGCNIVRMMNNSSKSDDTYEAVKPDSSPNYKLSRQMSGSTIDAHTKVREWITQEIIQKYSPRIFRKRRPEPGKRHSLIPDSFTLPQEIENNENLVQSDTAMKTSTITRPKVPKISVGVDATPSGRGASVLMQQPIEMSKSFDYSYMDAEPKSFLRRSITLEDFSPKNESNYHNQPTMVKIEHKHSNSDPVQDLTYSQLKKLKTFNPDTDISVTCRDEIDSPTPLTPEESLMTIKRRNFPKVLPDYPDKASLLNNRRSMPVCALAAVPDSHLLLSNLAGSFSKLPPTPPPRTTTLTKQASEPQPIFISEPTLMEETEEEPEIVCNNLYFGPLVPKNKAATLPMKESEIIKPKPIVSPNIKRADPKFVIKPTLSKKPSEEKCHKNIPRVCVPDNQPYQQQMPLKDAKIGLKSEQSIKENIDDNKTDNKNAKKSQIPMLIRTPSLNKESFSSESTPSEESDTGTVVKKV